MDLKFWVLTPPNKAVPHVMLFGGKLLTWKFLRPEGRCQPPAFALGESEARVSGFTGLGILRAFVRF